MYAQCISIQVGKPVTVEHEGKPYETGFTKTPAVPPLYVSKLNIEGDGQADTVHHGGPDKAICVYASERYPYWEGDLGRTLAYGAFGENFTTRGLLEQDVSIGDVFRIGDVVVQVSQPRQPCYKLARKHGVVDFPLRFEQTGYTGWYFRVLEEGWIGGDLSIRPVERDAGRISLAYANRIMHRDRSDVEGIRAVLAVDALSASWRATLEKRLAKALEQTVDTAAGGAGTDEDPAVLRRRHGE